MLSKYYEKYKSWWLNKKVSYPGGHCLGKVIEIELFGPPSGFQHSARLTLDNGGEILLPNEPNAYRPTKKSLVVIDSLSNSEASDGS